MLLSSLIALRAGQAVVQFVRAPQNNHHYAVKLFASRTAYEDEKQLYLHCFPKFMPTVIQFVDNQDGKFCDPTGGPMPPCLVMEKGESLTERTMRRKNDIFTTIQACPTAYMLSTVITTVTDAPPCSRCSCINPR